MKPVSIQENAAEAAELLGVLANENRLLVLCHLLDGEIAVAQLARKVGMTQTALSQQLARLRAMRLVATRRQGRTILYRLASPEIKKILDTLHEIFCSNSDIDMGDQISVAGKTASLSYTRSKML